MLVCSEFTRIIGPLEVFFVIVAGSHLIVLNKPVRVKRDNCLNNVIQLLELTSISLKHFFVTEMTINVDEICL